MTKNMGKIDRILRTIVGIGLLTFAFFFGDTVGNSPLLVYGAGIIGAVMVIASAVGFCPPYRLFGFSTCKSRQGR